jgi:hypothetical protein
MEITVKVECKFGWGQTTTSDLMTIKRPVSGLGIADVGLTLKEGKALLMALQSEVVQQQISEYSAFRGICHHCQNMRRRKDVRTRALNTVFGKVTVTGPRFIVCKCEHWIPFDFSPMSEVLKDRCTPELIFLQAQLAARLSFRNAAEFFQQFLPTTTRVSHETVRRRTYRVAKRIESAQSEIGTPADHEQVDFAYIGLDGAHVRARPGVQRRNHEIIVGRILAENKPGRMFTAIRNADQSAIESVRAAFYKARIGPRTAITVFTDGDDTLARLVEAAHGKPVTRILDWHHIVMRFQNLARAINELPHLAPLDRATIESAHECMKRLRYRLWHNQLDRASEGAGEVMRALAPFDRDQPDWCRGKRRQVHYLLEELLQYLGNNQGGAGRLRSPLPCRKANLHGFRRVHGQLTCEPPYGKKAANALDREWGSSASTGPHCRLER